MSKKNIKNYLLEIGIPASIVNIFNTTFWILILVVLISIILFTVDFWGTSFFQDITLWGYFGDFWWNLLTAIASILNLFAFIFVTVIVAEMQRKQTINNHKTQKEQSILALKRQAFLTNATIKTGCVSDLKNSINLLLENEFKDSELIRRTHLTIDSFQKTYLGVFFSQIDKSILIDSVSILKKLEEEVEHKTEKNRIIRSGLIDEFINQKDILLLELLKDIKNEVQYDGE